MVTKPSKLQQALRHGLLIGAGAFFLAILASLAAKMLLDSISSLAVSLILLLFIIWIGIIFDIVGVAAAAAKEAPLHARSSRKVRGANHAIQLVRNADKVGSFCNDVVGDVSGTLSGAVGAAIVIKILFFTPSINEVIIGTLMTSLIAGLIVAGKAFGKYYAIRHATDIIFHTGRLLDWMDVYLHINLIKEKNGKKN